MINEKPLVSIALPVYNGEKYIEKVLASLLAQDYGNLELIISDNFSTDQTFAICQRYAQKDKRIVLSRNATNIGVVKNYHAALNLARGPFFMWTAVDDYWFPSFVSALVEELQKHPQAQVAMCAFERTLEDGKVYDAVRFLGKDNPNDKSYFHLIKYMTSNKKYNLFQYGLFRTDFLKKAMKVCYDMPSWDRIFMCQVALGTPFRYVDKIFYQKLLHYKPYHLRWPQEKFSQVYSRDRFSDLKETWTVAKTIFYSKVVPARRKLFIPLAMVRYVSVLFKGRIKKRLRMWKDKLNPRTVNRLKRFRNIFLTQQKVI